MIIFAVRSSFWLAVGYVAVQHFSGGPVEQQQLVKQAHTRVTQTVDTFVPTQLLANKTTQKWIVDKTMKAGTRQIEELLTSAQSMPVTARATPTYTPVPIVTKPDRNNRG